MTKYALCLFGHLRGWLDAKESIINNVGYLDGVDVFVHTYYRSDYAPHYGNTVTTYTEQEIKDMFDGLNVKSIVIEDDSTAEWDEKLNNDVVPYRYMEQHGANICSAYSQFRKVNECKKLRDAYSAANDVTYDYTMYCRLGVSIDQKWGDHLQPDNFQNTKIYLGHCHYPMPQDLVVYGTTVMADIFAKRLEALDSANKIMTPMGGVYCDGNIMWWYTIELYTGGRHWEYNGMTVKVHWGQ